MKTTLTTRLQSIEALAREFAQMAQQHGLHQYLKAIGVTYEESHQSIYFVTMGRMSVNFAFGVGFSFHDRNSVIEWMEGSAYDEYAYKLEIFKEQLPGILEDDKQVRIKQLTSELEAISGVAA
ncbi:hypothetical protein MUK70_11640 [Dyadobacter chenwenxiniae]|uniref:Uncharacterized protein n=1 Tax=Dyadobacter chenwenxiniae TaxID=2906456 RepID=A0A9X1TCB5_9BACT|nr:hypothetical protein [Dyadobacter chenwenxiniae]MCF0059892.1 hypothetical protein [Dyadobacter chenwenxiniae]UON85632.1 hypothetical protein MUK70_11640 [Dyadobacter chenwenxiniae]